MPIEATWSNAVARLVTNPIRYDPRQDTTFMRDARDAGWQEVRSPLDFGFGPGLPSDPDLEWGVFAVHPEHPRVAIEVQRIGVGVTAARIGLWSGSCPVLVIMRAPAAGHPNQGTTWGSITGSVSWISLGAGMERDDLRLPYVIGYLDVPSTTTPPDDRRV